MVSSVYLWDKLVRSNVAKALPLVAIALFSICPPLFSQASNSAIAGAVYDQSHAVVGGATVSVTDVARGDTRTLVTDSGGEYAANNLIPGIYSVKAEAKGFQTVQQSNVVVEVGQNVRVDLTLTPGEQTQTITVTSEAPAVDTSDAEFGGTVNNDLVNSLPLNGRNFERLLQVRPGIVNNSVGAGTGTAEYTNGRKEGDDLYRIEGMASICNTGTPVSCVNDAYRGGDSSSILPIDAIQEFDTVQNPKAEEGWKEGSVVSLGLKSGTNAIHGTAYAFGRDASATDAANAFTHSVTPANLEQFGATAGGPVIKDKLFWFVGYEGLRDILGDTAVDTVPADITQGGSVGTSMVDACNALASTVLGKSTGPYEAVGTPGPNGVVTPLSAELAGITISPTGGCTVSPNGSTVGGNLIENVFPYSTTGLYNPPLTPTGPLDNGLFKVDYIPGPHHHISGTFFDAEGTQVINNATGQLEPQWLLNVHDNVKLYLGAWTWAPSSAWVNDVRFGANYYTNESFPADQNLVPANGYPNGYSFPTGVTNPVYGGFPYTSFSSFTGFLGAGQRGGSTIRGPEGNEDFVDNVSYLHGKHAFKFGFEYIDVFDDQGLQGASSVLDQGSLVFANLEGFLQGTPTRGSILVGDTTDELRSHWYAGFFQDDWRVKSRVTLNLGLRYEFETPPSERHNYLGNFDPYTFNPNVTPNSSAIQQVGPGEPLPTLFKYDKTNFSPRAGVAWDITGNGKNVIRGSLNLLTDYTPLQSLGAGQAVPFGANIPCLVVATSCTSSTQGINRSGTALNEFTPVSLSPSAASLKAGWASVVVTPSATGPTATGGPIFPVNPLSEVVNTVTYTGGTCNVPGIATGTPCTTYAVDPNFHQAHAAEWSLDFQRAITNNLTLDIAYVGNYGYGEIYNRDLDQPALGIGWSTVASGATLSPAALCANSVNLTAFTATCTSNSAAEVGQYTTSIPYLNHINQETNGAISFYDGLQVIVNQRVSHGLSYLVAYTYSHALDDTNSPDFTNLRDNLASSASDVRNRLTVSPNYMLPGSTKVPGQMAEGWSVSALITAQGGFAWYPADTTTDDLTGTGEFSNSGGAPNQTWNYVGSKSAFTSGPNPIPCYGPLSGCTPFTSTTGAVVAPASIVTECENAATSPYAAGADLPGTSVSLQQLALASFMKYGCYVAKGGTATPGGGILVAPAYGTLGDAGRNIFRGPGYFDVDMSVAKLWKFKERYSAQFRMEFFNLFNKALYTPAPTSTNPTAGAGGQFGCSCSTPDTSALNPNPVLGAGGPRHIQFALKLIF